MKFRDIPGYIILGVIGAVWLIGYAAVEIPKLLPEKKTEFETLTGFKTPEDMAAAQDIFQEIADRRIKESKPDVADFKKANDGDAEAQYRVGNLYLYGDKSQEKNYDEAWSWFQKSASQNYAPAQFQIGWMYANGMFVDQDKSEEVNWYLQAAENGDKVAQLMVGEMYLSLLAESFGLKRDFQEAYFWLSRGSQGEGPQSNFIRDRDAAKSHLSEKKLAEIQKRLDICKQ